MIFVVSIKWNSRLNKNEAESSFHFEQELFQLMQTVNFHINTDYSMRCHLSVTLCCHTVLHVLPKPHHCHWYSTVPTLHCIQYWGSCCMPYHVDGYWGLCCLIPYHHVWPPGHCNMLSCSYIPTLLVVIKVFINLVHPIQPSIVWEQLHWQHIAFCMASGHYDWWYNSCLL